MEVIINYGLVVIFFIVLFVLVAKVLAPHPYAEPLANKQSNTIGGDNTTEPGGYIAVVFILAVLVILSLVAGKKTSM